MAEEAKLAFLATLEKAKTTSISKLNAQLQEKIIEFVRWWKNNPEASRQEYDSKRNELEKIMEVYETIDEEIPPTQKA